MKSLLKRLLESDFLFNVDGIDFEVWENPVKSSFDHYRGLLGPGDYFRGYIFPTGDFFLSNNSWIQHEDIIKGLEKYGIYSEIGNRVPVRVYKDRIDLFIWEFMKIRNIENIKEMILRAAEKNPSWEFSVDKIKTN